ncbi:MAG: hypothetical protein GXP46_09145 [Deferribacteres bacterium]|nr:hypothetical protein [Deferribacteres bacterium]
MKKLPNVPPPPEHKTYKCDISSPVKAVAEFAPMWGVLIAYPGTVAPPEDKKQLPPSGPRSFGIPDELIIRMQQLDSKSEPVRIFIMCDDENQLPLIKRPPCQAKRSLHPLKKESLEREFNITHRIIIQYPEILWPNKL